MMRWLVPLLLLSRVAAAAIVLDQSGTTRNGANSTTCVTPAKTTTNASELVVVMFTGEASQTNPTISDTATLSWTRLNFFSGTSGGNAFSHGLFYATTSGILTSWTATVTTASQGMECSVWTFTGAGTPTNWTASSGTGSPATPACTITAGTGSYLVGMGSDDTTGGTLTTLANTTSNQGFGAASDLFFDVLSSSTVTGSTTIGFSTGTNDTYHMACAEIPASGGAGPTLPPTLNLLGVGQ